MTNSPARRSPAGRPRPVRQPRQGAGRDRGRPGDRRRHARAQGVRSNRGRCEHCGQRRASLRLARRREARRRPRPFRLRSRRPRLPRCRRLDRRLHPSAARARRAQSTPSMSAAGNCMTASRAARSRRRWKQTDIRTLSPARFTRRPISSSSTSASSRSSWCCRRRLRLRRPPAQLVALIKPQFEAGRAHAQKRHRARRRGARRGAATTSPRFVASLGWRVIGMMPSPIEGGDGNAEFLLGAVRDDPLEIVRLGIAATVSPPRRAGLRALCAAGRDGDGRAGRRPSRPAASRAHRQAQP